VSNQADQRLQAYILNLANCRLAFFTVTSRRKKNEPARTAYHDKYWRSKTRDSPVFPALVREHQHSFSVPLTG
jgi:hypothetical protein